MLAALGCNGDTGDRVGAGRVGCSKGVSFCGSSGASGASGAVRGVAATVERNRGDFGGDDGGGEEESRGQIRLLWIGTRCVGE